MRKNQEERRATLETMLATRPRSYRDMQKALYDVLGIAVSLPTIRTDLQALGAQLDCKTHEYYLPEKSCAGCSGDCGCCGTPE